MLIQRPTYLEKIKSYKDTQGIIKVITGIRRAGKSTLFKIYQDYLLKSGIKGKQIISINFENLENNNLPDYTRLFEYIKSKLTPNMNYIFFDEIQNVKDFQKVVNSLNLLENVDLYITGSNAYLLSGELSTLLSGRYIQIKIYPLSFKEYYSCFNNSDKNEVFGDYLKFGAFPYLLNLQNTEHKLNYLESIYNTIVIKDVIQRNKINDVKRLQKIILFICNNIGSLTSINNIKNQMCNDNFKINSATIENYITALINSFIIYKVPRYDIKGKELLKTNDKYYIADTGLKYFLTKNSTNDLGHMLENIVYLELLSRGYNVFVGKNGSLEVDFVAIKNDIIEYYQVSQTIINAETLERELKSLQNIKDNYPKYILTMDTITEGNYNGIQCINILKWLLK